MVLLAGCADRTPTGQVIATVNGEDVTMRDLAAEMSAIGYTGDAEQVRGPLLRQMVDRRLFVQAARAQGIDRSPEYLARFRRLREILLADMLVERMAREAPQPSPAELADHIAANPWAFAERRIVEVTDADGGDGANRRIDTADLTPDQARALTAAPIGATVTLDTAGGPYPLIVRRHIAAPVTGDAATGRASEALRKKQLDMTVEQFLTMSRNNADMRYQQGFGTPAS